jgi:hypothetical protein
MSRRWRARVPGEGTQERFFARHQTVRLGAKTVVDDAPFTRQRGNLRLSEQIEGPVGEALFRHSCAMNLDGIVSKKVTAPRRRSCWRNIVSPDYPRLRDLRAGLAPQTP